MPQIPTYAEHAPIISTDRFLGWSEAAANARRFTPAAVAAMVQLLLTASETATGVVELATTAEVVTGTDTTRAATAAGVKAAIDALIAAAPGALNTLDELAAALGDDANYAATITSALAGKQPLATVLTNTTASFLTADETKLDAIEALADVTDEANVAASGALMASGNLLGLDDPAEAVTNLGINVEAWVTRTGGGGRDIVTQTNVSGAVTLDLAGGSVQVISGSTGAPTFTVANPSSSGEVEFTLTTNQTHAPVWFSGITWVNGIEAIAWDGTAEEFVFNSKNGGTSWSGYHLTPTAPIDSVSFSFTGTLTISTGGHRLYNDSGETRTIASVRATVGTVPTGAAVKIDVNKNGTTIFTSQSSPDNRPTIAISGNTDQADAVQVASWANDEYLTVDVDQIGSTIAGANLVVTVNYRQG